MRTREGEQPLALGERLGGGGGGGGGGEDESSAVAALRAWRALAATARERGLPHNGLPAGDVLVADVVAGEKRRARAAGAGSRGGVTVGQTFLDGFATLQSVGVPVVADGPFAAAAAALTREEAVADAMVPRRQAGSMPIKMQLQLETLAAAKAPSVARTPCRGSMMTRGYRAGLNQHNEARSHRITAPQRLSGRQEDGR